MPATVYHAKTLTQADGTDVNVWRPSDFNSAHVVSISLATNEVVKYISAGTTSVSQGNVQFGSSAGNVSFGMNSNGYVTASAPSGGGGGVVERRYKELIQGERMTTCAALSATQFTNRPIFAPFWMEGTGIGLNTVRFIVSLAGSSNRSFGGTFAAGLYYQPTNNSTQATLVASDSMSFSITLSSQSVTYNGGMLMDFTRMSNYVISTEGRYIMAFACNPVSANATWMAASLYGADNMPALSRILRGDTTAATGEAILPWWGVYSTTTNAMPNSIGPSQVLGGNSASLVDYYCIIKEM